MKQKNPQQSFSYEEELELRKPNWLQSFFIMCSGADKHIMSECPSEFNKYSGIGATIFLTASLAVFTGGYALNFVFDNIPISILFGILWGIIIFNLDRYIVLSLRKEKIPTNTDILKAPSKQEKDELISDRSRMLWNQALMASPRFLIALVIAITISKPLELRLFSTKILKEHVKGSKTETDKFDEDENKVIAGFNKQLQDLNAKEEEEKKAIYANNPIYREAITKLPEIQSGINSKEGLIKTNNGIIEKNKYLETGNKQKQNPDTKEWETYPYKYWVKNATAREKETENVRLDKEKRDLETEQKTYNSKKDTVEKQLMAQTVSIASQYDLQRAPVKQSIENLQATYQDRKNRYIQTIQLNPDILERMQYLSNISSWFNPVWWASFVITLLFMLLETAPVVVKLLTKRGPYDDKLDRIEYEHYINETEIISRWNTKINELLSKAKEAAKLEGEVFIKVEKQRLDHELKNNQTILDDLAIKQETLAKIAIEKWYETELNKTKPQNPNPADPTPNKPQSKFEETFWKLKNSPSDIQYFFRNGSPTINELLYREDSKLTLGGWAYENTKSEILIDIFDEKRIYFINELTDTTLKLNEKGTTELIEFEKL
ncbi:MAG: DUF4407 domain-containing protein [Bacteroidia bacterium]|nr:DUF4407 domain-containing protein [Bacteroidia bacterium]